MAATLPAAGQLHELSMLQQGVTRKTLVSGACPIEDATNEEDLEPQDSQPLPDDCPRG